jgi:flagellar biosynthesis protein FlhF
MNQVRLKLGDDALILSSRMTDEGVEIMALAEEIQPPVSPVEPDDSPLPVSPQHAAAAYARQVNGFSAPSPTNQPAALHNLTPDALPAPQPDFAALSERLLSEIKDMRQLIDSQAARSTGHQGCRPQLLKWLLDAGFSAGLSEELIGATSPQLEGPDATPARLQAWLAHQLESHLNQLGDEAELFDNTHIIALVGPTGVGKTTTTAKLAARYVMRHGANHVALLTTDSFRIGAHEQLAIYARLLGVELHALTPASELGQVLAELADKRLIIIDTVGMSQRDQRLLTQINQLGSSGRNLRLMLVINAASHGDTLEEVVKTYRLAAKIAGCSLDDCIISKCDEAVRIGPALDTVIRHGLRLNYLSVGQQVPEDLQLAATSNLMQQTLDVAHPSLFAAKPASSTSQRLDALVRGVLGQSRSLLTLRESLKNRIVGFEQLLEAWPLMNTPLTRQNQRWPAWLSTQELSGPVAPDAVLFWGASRPQSGATWNMPLLIADHTGQLQAQPWLVHRLPIGTQPRLDWCLPRWPNPRHLWSICPPGETLAALRLNDQSWLSAAKGSQRVMFQGELHRLGTLVTHAQDLGFRELRYCGKNVRLSLGHLPVSLGGPSQEPLRAWLGTLHDSHSGQLLGQRCWLAGSDTQETDALQQQEADLILQLTHDELAALTGRAWKLLPDIQPQLHAELRLFIAAGLAATAMRLANARDDWAFQARAQLMGLLPKKRTGNTPEILEGLLHLLTLGDAFARVEQTPDSFGL